MIKKIAKIAVNAATYVIDKPYDYVVPDNLYNQIMAGCRVFVPFSRGNRIVEGLVLSLFDEDLGEDTKLKTIESLIDKEPILDENQIQLALFMHSRYFCTVYDAVKCIIPSSLWIKHDGSTRIKEKIMEVASLLISPYDCDDVINAKLQRAKQQSNILRELSVFGQLPVRELLLFTGASKSSLNKLVDNGYVEILNQEILRKPNYKIGDKKEIPTLNEKQLNVFKGINTLISKNEYGVSLLQGVTGSGKTSIYIHLIKRVLDSGKDAILLVPEIALTPQMLRTFSSYFGDNIAVLHSSLSYGERYDEWFRVKNKKAHLTIGTRSAIFSPTNNLGLIIIDEEQEESYISENNPRYNAIEIAQYRCFKSNCHLLLGSATPQITSKYLSSVGKFNYFELDKRYNNFHLPDVSIVDMKEELKKGNNYTISSFLRDEIQKNIENNEQTILFLNRRGANRLVICGNCGYTYKCPNCSVSLTYHSINNKLRCHYCGYSHLLDSKCPSCGGKLKKIGAGTQLVENELHELFPNADILRMDADVINKTITHEKLFDKFKEEKIPIMIGTQMVTKGLNFENVTLVGVLSADAGLYVSNYKATERTFSLITQVIGRSGRGSKAGRAVIQTYTPSNDTIVLSSKQDYNAFYDVEINLRKQQCCPPFFDLLAVSISGTDDNSVLEAAHYIKLRLNYLLSNYNDIIILGPTPYSVVKINNRYRYRVIIKCHVTNKIREIISNIVKECSIDKKFKNLTFFAENNPED